MGAADSGDKRASVLWVLSGTAALMIGTTTMALAPRRAMRRAEAGSGEPPAAHGKDGTGEHDVGQPAAVAGSNAAPKVERPAVPPATEAAEAPRDEPVASLDSPASSAEPQAAEPPAPTLTEAREAASQSRAAKRAELRKRLAARKRARLAEWREAAEQAEQRAVMLAKLDAEKWRARQPAPAAPMHDESASQLAAAPSTQQPLAAALGRPVKDAVRNDAGPMRIVIRASAPPSKSAEPTRADKASTTVGAKVGHRFGSVMQPSRPVVLPENPY